MGATIRSKSQIVNALGTEAIPINTALGADGWLTAQQIANLVAASFGGVVVYNVRSSAYGARGNGTTDDSAACQAAINDCQAGGGGFVFFPPGVYALNTAGCLVTGNSVTLWGAGRYATILQVPQNAPYPAVELRGNSGARNAIRHQVVRGMTCCMGGFSTTAGSLAPAFSGTTPGIKSTYNVFSRIEDVNIFGFQTGLYAYQTNNINTRDVYIAPLTTTSTCDGVYLDNAGNSVASMNLSPKITFTSFDGTNTAGARTGFYVGNGGAFQDLLIAHCEADNATIGYYLDGTGASTQELGSDAHLDHCIADRAETGYYINNAGSSIRTQVDMDACQYASAPSAQCAVAVAGSSGVHVRGLQANGNVNGGDGVRFSGASSFCTVTDGQFDAVTNGVTSTSNCSTLGIHENIFMPSVTTPIALNGAANCKGRGNIGNVTLADFG